jgi:hypothetical protein
LVGTEKTVREPATTASYRNFTDEQYVNEFGPVGVNLEGRLDKQALGSAFGQKSPHKLSKIANVTPPR